MSRKLGADADDVQARSRRSASSIPAPGRRFAEDNNRVVVPDVTVENDGDEWKISLNSDYIPRLRISSTYRDLIAKGTLSKEERDYLRDRMRSGKFLIDSIEQRQRTIERITREIIKAQKEFFENGVSAIAAADDDPDRGHRRRARDHRQPSDRQQIHEHPARRLRLQILLHDRAIRPTAALPFQTRA